MIRIKYYYPPHGNHTMIDMHHINPEEEAYFRKYDYDLSIEALDAVGNDIVVYARAPHDHDGVDEVAVFARGRDCFTTMKELAESCREVYNLI